MSQRVSGGRPVAWEDAGRQVAPVLGSYAAIVVISSDPLAAAYVALGIAHVEAQRRRSVVGDLVGDISPLRSLVKDEDAPGITDSLLYGVSLNKIGYEVEGTKNLYIMPSGTDPLVDEELMQSRRWKKLATGFDQTGAFLILVANSSAAGLADLIDQLDGAVLVKDVELPGAPSALILARVAGPTPTLKIPLLRITAAAKRWHPPKWFYPALAAFVLLLIAGVTWAVVAARSSRLVASGKTLAPKIAAAPVPVHAPAETVHVDPPANAVDSSIAPAFSVELLLANTAEGANLFVRKNGAALPAAAVSPVPIGAERATWYRVTAGAYATRNQADSLLLSLRRGGILAGDSTGSVTQVPLALLIDSVPTQGGITDAVRAAMQKYNARGMSVYPLIQNDGGARLYAGAFATAGQSVELMKTLRTTGLKPVLVYRTGSTP